jgi:hypothetical protein
MTAAMNPAVFPDALNALLDETFDAHHGIYLDKGTSLFETLDAISAAEASKTSGNAATIAAHVVHVTFYLEVLERYIEVGPSGPVDWREIWRDVHAVTPGEWDDIRRKLRTVAGRVRTALAQRTEWDDERAVGGALAMVAHTAYHLGSIRHAIKGAAAER